jgi:hypothetical protein
VKRVLVILAVLVSAGVALTATTASATVIHKCIPDRQAGTERDGSATLITYCGHAKLTLKSAGKSTHWKNGMCLKIIGVLRVGFGKYTTFSTPNPISVSLILTIPLATDGTSKLATIEIQHKGQKTKNASHMRAVVRGNRSRGTFSGTFLQGAKFSGSFTCK